MRKKLGRGAGQSNSRQSNKEASQRRIGHGAKGVARVRLGSFGEQSQNPHFSRTKRARNGAPDIWVKGCKERGEWAELCFMARAAGLGMGVLKPFGDSLRFDVGVMSGERIWRVQVKSTIYCRRGNEYSLNVMGPGRKQYRPGTVDFFAVYLIPVNQWYIIPYDALGKKLTVHFTPGGTRQKYAPYLEAWELLRDQRSPWSGRNDGVRDVVVV
jgi:hypothetical protein